jgi:membrane fusion protein (multidrug efflux system)
MTVVPVQDLYLVANFKETQVGRMRPGQPVEITVDALPGAKVNGTVDSLAPGTGSEFALLPPENATGNFTKIVQRVPVRIRIAADGAVRAALRPGLSVEAEVNTK